MNNRGLFAALSKEIKHYFFVIYLTILLSSIGIGWIILTQVKDTCGG